MKRTTNISLGDVLEAFSLEPEADKLTLEKYLRDYPEYAGPIIDLALECSLESGVRQEVLTERERSLIESSWKKHIQATPKRIVDPFAVLSPKDLGNISKSLSIPRQVLTALRDRAVVATSIPQRFVGLLAAQIRTDLATLEEYLESPPALCLERSRKSVAKPQTADRKTFEEILVDGGVSPELRAELMAED